MSNICQDFRLSVIGKAILIVDEFKIIQSLNIGDIKYYGVADYKERIIYIKTSDGFHHFYRVLNDGNMKFILKFCRPYEEYYLLPFLGLATYPLPDEFCVLDVNSGDSIFNEINYKRFDSETGCKCRRRQDSIKIGSQFYIFSKTTQHLINPSVDIKLVKSCTCEDPKYDPCFLPVSQELIDELINTHLLKYFPRCLSQLVCEYVFYLKWKDLHRGMKCDVSTDID